MSAKRLVLLALAGAIGFSLSGCAQSGNHAAQVGDEVITTSDVDFLTRMQCGAINQAAKDPAQAGQVQKVATRQVRAQMVNALVQAVLNAQVAKREGASYDRATYRQVMDQFEPAVQAAPKKDRERFRDLVGSFYRGQLEVFTVAQAELAATGVAQPTDQQVQEAVAAVQDDYRKTVDIEINPVYGPDAKGVAGAQDPSLSRAVSDFAKLSSATEPSAEWVAGLPATMRCG